MNGVQSFFFWVGIVHAVVDVAVIAFVAWFCRHARLEAQRLEQDSL